MKLGYLLITGILFIISITLLSTGLTYRDETNPIIWILTGGFFASTVISFCIGEMRD